MVLKYHIADFLIPIGWGICFGSLFKSLRLEKRPKAYAPPCNQTGGKDAVLLWGILLLLPGGSCRVSQNFWVSSLKPFFWTHEMIFLIVLRILRNLMSKQINQSRFCQKKEFLKNSFLTNHSFFFFMNLNPAWKMLYVG